jgi:D-alanine-D-alanine ligase
MKICVLSDETFGDYTPAYYLKDYDWDMHYVKKPILDFLGDLARDDRYSVYLNLCDGGVDEDRPGFDLVAALEELNLPFTGANASFYNPTREHMQSVAEQAGVRFATGFRATSLEDLSRAEGLCYPLMVKHPHSYGSIGMTPESRVENTEQLRVQTEKMLEIYGSARVEEFIDGREFTCLVVDNPDDLSNPFVYPCGELIFPKPNDFLHTSLKWDVFLPIERVTDESIKVRVEEMSKRMYLGMNGVGYGRTDLRMRDNGELVMLEINPNAAILYMPEENGPADVPITFDPDGHRGFFDRIFRAAQLRRDLRARAGES